MANYSFVKFQRGTLAAYNNLRVKDPDTLYFIYADANNQYGSLYLGDKLISGGEVSVVSSSMSDLSDTQLSNVQDGQILIYDSSTSKWKNFDLATAIENAGIEIGATVSNITPEAGETDAEALEDISEPAAGDIAFVGDNIYIYDGTEWREIAGVENIESRISDLETLVGQPASGNDPATGLHAVVAEKIDATQANALIATAIGNANHLSYQKVGSLNAIDTSATNADRYIYLVPQNPGSLDDLYDEYLVIDGELEKMGQWGVGTLSELETAVGNLEDIVNGIPASGNDPAVPGLVNTVGNLNDIINGIPASGDDPAVPGLVGTVSNLNDIINGIPASDNNPAVPGLADRVTILETAVGDLSQLYNYDAQNPVSIVNTINEINERLVWQQIDGSENEPETPEGN